MKRFQVLFPPPLQPCLPFPQHSWASQEARSPPPPPHLSVPTGWNRLQLPFHRGISLQSVRVRLNFDKVGLTARHSKIHPHAQFILKTCGNLVNVFRSRHRKIRWNCFEDKIVKIVLFRHRAIIVETKAHWHRSNCIEVLQHELPHKRPCGRSNQVDLKIPGLKKLTMTSFTWYFPSHMLKSWDKRIHKKRN